VTKTEAFERFCLQHTFWSPLLHKKKEESKLRKEKKRQVFPYPVGHVFYQDLQAWGSDWARTRDLPDFDTVPHMVMAKIISLNGKDKLHPIQIRYEVFGKKNDRFLSRVDALVHSAQDQLHPNDRLVDKAFLERFPQVAI